MPIQIANAPCSWGVDFADLPENPPWSRCLDEVAAAGYTHVDLGPVDYFPTDPALLAEELARRGLGISAGGLFDPLYDPACRDAVLEKARRTCALAKALGASRLVIIDCVSELRGATAGRSADAPRLPGPAWHGMMQLIKEIATLARDGYGVKSYLHAHAGCYIEFEDEIDRAMADLPADLVGLCVDTGHSAYAGIDPAALVSRYDARVGHLHLKDIDPGVLAACRAAKTGFFESIAQSVFCPLGRGMVDFRAVRAALDAVGYDGIGVVEQDVDPAGTSSPLENARASLSYLREMGIAL
jgi:inosose dehydratase